MTDRDDMPEQMWLFTNRNCLVFNAEGKQIPYYQRAIFCYGLDPEIAMECTLLAKQFFIAQWRAWAHEIDRKEMQSLLGLRTHKMDMEERRDSGIHIDGEEIVLESEVLGDPETQTD